MNAQTDTGAAQFQVGERVTCPLDGRIVEGKVFEIDDNTVTVDIGGALYLRTLESLRHVNQERTREGGTERTAAAGSTSRAFQVGDRVSFTIGKDVGFGNVKRVLEKTLAVKRDSGVMAYPMQTECVVLEPAKPRPFAIKDTVVVSIGGSLVRGEIIEFGPDDTAKVLSGEVAVWRALEDLAPVADPPQWVVGRLQDDESTDLDEVEPEDKLTGAALDAAQLIVRICEAGDLTLRERVVINGVTWVVDVHKE